MTVLVFPTKQSLDPRCSRCKTSLPLRCAFLLPYSCLEAQNSSHKGAAGNPLKGRFLEVPCYNLVYLELAACRLTSLPEDMARLAPNLRVLNLNYNFLEDARPLGGLERLKKLTIIGSRLKGTKPLIRLLQGMPDVEMLDFRYAGILFSCFLDCILFIMHRGTLSAFERSIFCLPPRPSFLSLWLIMNAK